MRFNVQVEDIPTAYGRAIRREQIRLNINNEQLAARVGMSKRNLYRVIMTGNCSVATLERILFEFGLELTVQPIGADFKEELENGKC